MEIGSELLPWIIALGLAFALLDRTIRRRRGRRRRSRRRRGSVGRPSRNFSSNDRRRGGRRFPRETLSGRVIRVLDGDSLIAVVPGFGRLNVRLAFVDAPEHGQPWGQESRDALARLARGSPARFRLLYRDRYARAVAVVSAGGAFINAEMVRHGHAWVYWKYVPTRLRKRFGALEHAARQSRVGLWGASEKPVPPWEWRGRATLGWFARLMKLLGRIFRAGG